MPSFAGIQLDITAVVRSKDRRKYLATLVFGGFALMASPLGAASSAKEAEVSPTVTIDHVPVPGLHDQTAMILVGAALIGLAAAVRRAA